MSAKGGTNAHKDVLYIDVDDEITGIIDKVRGSDQKIVALVLPKRAAVLQSIVNMKLLKRASDSAKKKLVLITSESGLLPLAGSVGIHVAKSLNSKPELPDAPDRTEDKPETVKETEDDDQTEAAKDPVDRSKTVGELAGAAAVESEMDDTIELDDEELPDVPETAGKTSKFKLFKLKGKKKFNIPNFNKFRLLLVAGAAALILLGGGVYAAVVVMPKAKITVKTDSTALNSSVVVNLKTGADVMLDTAAGTVPAQIQEVKKTLTQQAPATGQINNGEKAAGSITMTAKNCTSLATPSDVPAGTGVTANGKTFITQKKANFGGSGVFDGSCINFKANNITIIAQSGGAGHNVESASFTVAGRADVTGTGSADGGTDNITKVVTQADIDSAKQKIGAQDTEQIQQELKSSLIGRSLYAIDATFTAGTPETTTDVKANDPAENVTVTQIITYTMLGAKQEDLEKVIAQDAKRKIDTAKQSITDYGIDQAVFGLQTANPDGATVTMQTTVVAGAELDPAQIKKQVAGKKANDAKELIKANPGVTDVTVTYSPFWVSSIPSNTSKITVTIEEPKVTSSDDAEPSP